LERDVHPAIHRWQSVLDENLLVGHSVETVDTFMSGKYRDKARYPSYEVELGGSEPLVPYALCYLVDGHFVIVCPMYLDRLAAPPLVLRKSVWSKDERGCLTKKPYCSTKFTVWRSSPGGLGALFRCFDEVMHLQSKRVREANEPDLFREPFTGVQLQLLVLKHRLDKDILRLLRLSYEIEELKLRHAVERTHGMWRLHAERRIPETLETVANVREYVSSKEQELLALKLSWERKLGASSASDAPVDD
jgi:hypothetical protein